MSFHLVFWGLSRFALLQIGIFYFTELQAITTQKYTAPLRYTVAGLFFQQMERKRNVFKNRKLK